jgi:hypothetical protein
MQSEPAPRAVCIVRVEVQGGRLRYWVGSSVDVAAGAPRHRVHCLERGDAVREVERWLAACEATWSDSSENRTRE